MVEVGTRHSHQILLIEAEASVTVHFKILSWFFFIITHRMEWPAFSITLPEPQWWLFATNKLIYPTFCELMWISGCSCVVWAQACRILLVRKYITSLCGLLLCVARCAVLGEFIWIINLFFFSFQIYSMELRHALVCLPLCQRTGGVALRTYTDLRTPTYHTLFTQYDYRRSLPIL